jgi:hypothetical protein
LQLKCTDFFSNVDVQAEVARVCKSGGCPCQMNFAQQRDIGSEGCSNTYCLQMMRYFHGGSAEARRAVLHFALADAGVSSDS